MTAQEQERQARARLRSLNKARRARSRNVDRRRRTAERDRERFRGWLRRERVAFAAHAAEPDDRRLQRAWIKILAEMPPLYGRRERSDAA